MLSSRLALCRRVRVVLVLCVLWAPLTPMAFAEQELVDRIVAIIDREVVTLSEVELAEAVVVVRREREGEQAAIVERLIEARLVEREVARFNDEPIEREEIEAQVEQFRARFESPEAFETMLSSNGITSDDLAAVLARQLSVSRYLERRFRALTHVTEDEIDAYFDEEVVPTLSSSREASGLERAQIRRILEEQKFTERVDNWIETLKSRASIRRYVW